MGTTETPWIAHRTVKPRARIRLLCFPYAGSGASIYRTWGEELPDTVEICPVQLPGRENRYREPAYSRFEPLIEALCDGLKPLLEFPYALFGYSMGAFIAFELARKLRRRGDCGPKRLFISARRGPRLADTRQAISDLPDAEFIQQLATYEGTPKDIIKDPEIMAFYLSTLRADFRLCETYKYVPGELLNCPLSVYGGCDDASLTHQDIQAWNIETTSSCAIKLFNGGHFFIHSCRTALLQSLAGELSSTVS